MHCIGAASPTCLHCCPFHAQDPDLRQAAVYGLGIAAQHRADAFRPVAQQSSQLLLAIAAAPDAHSDTNANATDNAVAALGKVPAWAG